MSGPDTHLLVLEFFTTSKAVFNHVFAAPAGDPRQEEPAQDCLKSGKVELREVGEVWVARPSETWSPSECRKSSEFDLGQIAAYPSV
jgi:hypothetical protein